MKNLFRQDKVFYNMLSSIAIPIALQSLMTFSLPLLDTFFLGVLGQNEIAAATLANAPFFTISMIIFGFQSGASILINQYFGKGDTRAISRIFGITLIAAFIVTFVASTICFIFPYHIMKFFTPDPILQKLAGDYMRVVSFSYTLNIFTGVYVMTQRCVGNAKAGVYITSIAMVSNLFLNWVFIFGKLGMPALGVVGAAIGTMLSRVIELMATTLYAKFNKGFHINTREALTFDKQLTKDLIKVAAPVVINETFWGVGVSLYPAIFSRAGTFAVAAYTIASNVEKIVTVIARGIADSSGVIVGKELGANRFYNATSYTRTLFALSVTLNSIIGVILIFSADSLANFFNISPEATKLAVFILILFAIKMPFGSFNHIGIVGILRAGGDSRAAMFIELGSLWLVGVLGAFLMVFVIKPSMTALIFVPLLFDDIGKTIITSLRIRTGLWIKNITREEE